MARISYTRVGALLALSLVTPSVARAQRPVGELKAEVIERFTRFIEWPSDVLPAGAAFVVCILGSGDTAAQLAALAGERKFKDRTCDVRRLAARAGVKVDYAACHLLYIPGHEAASLRQVIDNVAGKAVLTVGDEPGFAEKGVLINLVLEGRFVRFQINRVAVERSRLFFSSKLLRLGLPMAN